MKFYFLSRKKKRSCREAYMFWFHHKPINISLLRFTLMSDTVKFSTSDGISLQQKTRGQISLS